MFKMRSFTLLELIIVVIIIGILATLAMPAYKVTKERALDNEAIANLKLIQAAQKIYGMERNTYICCGYTSDNINCINDALKLDIPHGNWLYATFCETDSSGAPGCTSCERNGADHRKKHLHIDSDEIQEGNCP